MSAFLAVCRCRRYTKLSGAFHWFTFKYPCREYTKFRGLNQSNPLIFTHVRSICGLASDWPWNLSVLVYEVSHSLDPPIRTRGAPSGVAAAKAECQISPTPSHFPNMSCQASRIRMFARMVVAFGIVFCIISAPLSELDRPNDRDTLTSLCSLLPPSALRSLDGFAETSAESPVLHHPDIRGHSRPQ